MTPKKIYHAQGHAFGPKLLCPCGRSWRQHQAEPIDCPNRAEVEKSRHQRFGKKQREEVTT